MALIKLNNQSLTNVTSAGLPSGTVLQIVSTTKTDAFDASSASPSSPIDVTGFSLNITPKSTSSKILVQASLNYGGNDNVYGSFYFLRGSTNLVLSTAVSGSNVNNASLAVHGDNNNFQYGLQSASFEYIDSPSSTSQLTYKMQMATHNGSTPFYLNRPYQNGNHTYVHGGTSTLTLMEIAG